MKRKSSKFLSILVGIGLLGAGYAHAAAAAEECAPRPPVCPERMIDTCNYGVMFGTKGHETKKLCFSGLIQTDYNFISVNDKMLAYENTGGTTTELAAIDPTDTNCFPMRRVRVGFHADLGEGWKGVIVIDLAERRKMKLYPVANESVENPAVTSTVITTANKHGVFGLRKAYVEKWYQGNSFKAGYRKVNFGREENVPCKDLKTQERSVVTEYFNESITAAPKSGSPLGFGERHVGLYMDGLYDNFGYGVAVVNGFQGTGVSGTGDVFNTVLDNELGFFANAYYAGIFNNIDLQIGFNAGYKPKGNNYTLSTVMGSGTGTFEGKRGSIFGWNPYLMATWKEFSILAEFLGSKVERGAVNATSNADPYGLNVIPSYMLTDQFELVGRASYLDSENRGVRISNVIRNAPDASNTGGMNQFVANEPHIFNRVYSWYAGFNYYMMNKAIKFSAGYEYFQFKDRHEGLTATTLNSLSTRKFTGDKAVVHALRGRVQLVF